MILQPQFGRGASFPGREETFICRICGRIKPKNAPNQRHCSEACKMEAGRRRDRQRRRRRAQG